MTQASVVKLKRALTLPWLVFYGIGVTVGAGIFALVGEIVAIAGDQAVIAFLLAGLIAGVSGVSYARLAGVYPRAGGEVVYVHSGFGPVLGSIVGYGVLATAIISSAVIATAFASYLQVIVPVPQEILIIGIIVILCGIAWRGVRESVAFAGLITLLEVGTLIVIFAFGVPLLVDGAAVERAFTPPAGGFLIAPIISAVVIAFFAFLGFEDIVNMAEETVDPERNVRRAVYWTLGVTVLLYSAITLTAVALPDRVALTDSGAPLVVLFEHASGRSGATIAAIASVAMVNGILVQIVMASRVFYGMSRERLMPHWLGALDRKRQTPRNAILVIGIVIVILALAFPRVRLAEVTSLVILGVFTLVNLALWRIGRRPGHPTLRPWAWWGVFGATLTIGVLGFEAARMLGLV